jgi:hypothetical protein
LAGKEAGRSRQIVVYRSGRVLSSRPAIGLVLAVAETADQLAVALADIGGRAEAVDAHMGEMTKDGVARRRASTTSGTINEGRFACISTSSALFDRHPERFE